MTLLLHGHSPRCAGRVPRCREGFPARRRTARSRRALPPPLPRPPSTACSRLRSRARSGSAGSSRLFRCRASRRFASFSKNSSLSLVQTPAAVRRQLGVLEERVDERRLLQQPRLIDDQRVLGGPVTVRARASESGRRRCVVRMTRSRTMHVLAVSGAIASISIRRIAALSGTRPARREGSREGRARPPPRSRDRGRPGRRAGRAVWSSESSGRRPRAAKRADFQRRLARAKKETRSRGSAGRGSAKGEIEEPAQPRAGWAREAQVTSRPGRRRPAARAPGRRRVTRTAPALPRRQREALPRLEALRVSPSSDEPGRARCCPSASSCVQESASNSRSKRDA